MSKGLSFGAYLTSAMMLPHSVMSRKRNFLLFRVAVTVVLLLALYRHASAQALIVDISKLHFPYVAGCFGLLFVNTWLSALKWKMLLRIDGIDQPLRTLFANYLMGSFFNIFLPSNIGGDAYRIASLGGGCVSKSAASVLADRISGLVALTIVCVVFSIFQYELLAHHLYIVFPGLLLAVLCVICWSVLGQRGARRIFSLFGANRFPRLMSFFDTLLKSFSIYRQRPVTLAMVMSISFVFQFVSILCIFLLSRAVDLKIDFLNFCVFVPIISVLEAIPISIYGLGIRDSGYVFFFEQIGLSDPQTHGLEMSVIYVLTTVIYTMFGGILFIWRRKRGP